MSPRANSFLTFAPAVQKEKELSVVNSDKNGFGSCYIELKFLNNQDKFILLSLYVLYEYFEDIMVLLYRSYRQNYLFRNITRH